MLSTRQIRRRIRSVGNIERLTSALKMVAGARLRRLQQRVEAGRAYADKMQEIMRRLAAHAGEVEHPLLEVREPARRGLVVMSSMRGLCGSYAHNIHRLGEAQLKEIVEEGREPVLITVGRKGREYFSRRGYRISQSFDRLSAESSHAEIRVTAERLRKMYEEKEVDRLEIAYTRFLSVGRQAATVTQLLPLPRPEEREVGEGEYIFEPPPAELFRLLLPRYIDDTFRHFLSQATASEQAARAMAMSQASENAREMTEKLTLQYNKSRQASITAELLDVVAGAEAQKG